MKKLIAAAVFVVAAVVLAMAFSGNVSAQFSGGIKVPTSAPTSVSDVANKVDDVELANCKKYEEFGNNTKYNSLNILQALDKKPTKVMTDETKNKKSSDKRLEFEIATGKTGSYKATFDCTAKKCSNVYCSK